MKAKGYETIKMRKYNIFYFIQCSHRDLVFPWEAQKIQVYLSLEILSIEKSEHRKPNMDSAMWFVAIAILGLINSEFALFLIMFGMLLTLKDRDIPNSFVW